MKLFFSPAYCSLAVHIALRASGQPFSIAKVDTVSARVEDGSDFRAVNARGYVPVLELADGSRHTEVAALLQYVGDAAPDSGLMPAFESPERFEVLQWLTFVSSELHKAFSPWLFHKETADSTRKAVKEKITLRLQDLEQPHRPQLAGGRQLHGRRCVCLHHRAMGTDGRHVAQRLSATRGLPGTRGSIARSARRARRRGAGP